MKGERRRTSRSTKPGGSDAALALLLTESDVTRLLRMEDVIPAVERAFLEHGRERTTNRPRDRIQIPGLTLQVMSAALPAAGVLGLKAYTTGSGGSRFVVLAWSTATGQLEAVIEADRMGQMRTGAASGVATRYMARPEARTVGCIGTGWQAETQIEAVCAVRRITRVLVFGRDARRRQAFASRMAERLRIPVDPAASAEAAVRESEIVITITTSRTPILRGQWLRAGTHINAAGVNWAEKRELDDDAVTRAARIAVDDRAQAAIECGDLIPLVGRGTLSWEQIGELGEIVAGKIPGRGGADEITLFESQGLAIEDMAAASLLLERARAEGVGQEIPIGR
jgi:ornithine cyclodeaminase/alanine dehydrogenase-like protein (mu-crystallin family)